MVALGQPPVPLRLKLRPRRGCRQARVDRRTEVETLPRHPFDDPQ
jgi:hypothetical protein